MKRTEEDLTRSEIIKQIGLSEENAKKHINELVNLRNYIVGAEDAEPDWKPSYMDTIVSLNVAVLAIDMLYKIKAASDWIPVRYHFITEEEKPEYADDVVYVFDNMMPADDQEILVTTKHGSVEKDVCYIDGTFSLDSDYDWITDIAAWMPLPEAYREEPENDKR